MTKKTLARGLFVLLSAICFASSTSAQTSWWRAYGGSGYDDGSAVQQTSDSGYIVTGGGYSFGAGNADAYLIKTNALGDTLWMRTYGGTRTDGGNSVRQTADGGYIVTGFTWSFGTGAPDSDNVYLIKTNAQGDTFWTRTYGGPDNDVGNAVQQTTDGGYIIAGRTYSFGAGTPVYENVYLVKTNAQGDTLWTRTYGGTGDDGGMSVQQTSDGGYIMAGYTASFGAGGRDVYLIKTNASGDTLWARTYGGTSDDLGWGVQQTADSGYIITGYTNSFGAGNGDVYLIKTDSLGNVGVAEPNASPTRVTGPSLSCEPNPFNRRVRIGLSTRVSPSKPVSLRVYGAEGRLVSTPAVTGEAFAVWDGRDNAGRLLPSGAYLVRCDVAGRHATARLILQH